MRISNKPKPCKNLKLLKRNFSKIVNALIFKFEEQLHRINLKKMTQNYLQLSMTRRINSLAYKMGSFRHFQTEKSNNNLT